MSFFPQSQITDVPVNVQRMPTRPFDTESYLKMKSYAELDARIIPDVSQQMSGFNRNVGLNRMNSSQNYIGVRTIDPPAESARLYTGFDLKGMDKNTIKPMPWTDSFQPRFYNQNLY